MATALDAGELAEVDQEEQILAEADPEGAAPVEADLGAELAVAGPEEQAPAMGDLEGVAPAVVGPEEQAPAEADPEAVSFNSNDFPAMAGKSFY